jgi:LmbE family N-acetylglucosaminyl deacetylase
VTAQERSATALFVVAHPDDAEIPAGGTIAMLTDGGVRVVTAVLSMPERGAEADERKRLTERAADLLGAELCWPVGVAHWGVSEMSELEVVAVLDRLMADVRPLAVFTHWIGDGHVDHRLTARATAAATRRHRVDHYAFRPAEPRTPALTQFAPQAFVDVTKVSERKQAALAPFGVARRGFRPVDLEAVEATDRFYGRLGGVELAEGFVVVRQYGLGAMSSPGLP